MPKLTIKNVITILKTQHPCYYREGQQTPKRRKDLTSEVEYRGRTKTPMGTDLPPLITISCRRDWLSLTSVSKSPHLHGVNVFCLRPVGTRSASVRRGNEFPTRMAFSWPQIMISRPRMSFNVFSPANGTSMFINVKCIMSVVYLVVIARRLKWMRISKGIHGYSLALESPRTNLFELLIIKSLLMNDGEGPLLVFT